MKIIDANTSLATIIIARPDLAATFETLGLDYCCGGDRRLGDACETAGLDLDDLVAQLSERPQVERAIDWPSLGPSELADHVEETHHVYLRDALKRIAELMERVIGAHGDRHPELFDVGATFGELRADLEPHLLKEERVLFPMIRELYASTEVPVFHCGSLQNPIGVMSVEHDHAGALLARLRALTSVYTAPSDGCASYVALYGALAELEADTHLHIHKENNLLFPAAVAEELRRTSP